MVHHLETVRNVPAQPLTLAGYRLADALAAIARALTASTSTPDIDGVESLRSCSVRRCNARCVVRSRRGIHTSKSGTSYSSTLNETKQTTLSSRHLALFAAVTMAALLYLVAEMDQQEKQRPPLSQGAIIDKEHRTVWELWSHQECTNA